MTGTPTDGLAAESFCYVTTTGRRTGNPHRIEIWFGMDGDTIYLLSGGGDRSDWVRNMVQTPDVTVRIGEQTFGGRARIVSDPSEDRLARDLLFVKYDPTYDGDLTTWRDSALPVAVDIRPATGSA
jgi:deazaflavin-dependent oxidoreductase (nitroreductase family)